MKPEINLIVAVSKNLAIGKDNKLLWHLPADLKFFKQTTMGCPVVMGRKTFESIGRVLPGRKNVILTRNKDFCPEGTFCFADFNEAINFLKDDEKIFIAGGGEIYKQLLNRCKFLFITFVNVTINDADTFFPDIHSLNQFELIWEESHEADDKNAFAYRYTKFKNKNL